MKQSSRLLVLATLLVTGASYGQNVNYERYQLPNGMTVILHEDHTLPQTCVDLWYYVASKDEPPGRSGFAHLFEHLMFMGTRRVPGGEFDTIMEAGGGFNNASTSEDRTNYFSLGPAELLPTLLWLDADRLEDLGKEMTQEKLDKQRDVVRNERRQTSENRPYGKADLMVHPLMFPKGHPYHNTVIGSHEDLEAATVQDVKNFFAKYYVPCNAGLVVAGDFQPDRIKPLIDNMFGTLPRGNDVIHPTAKPVTLSRVKRLTMTDAVQFARTTMVYHSPPRFQPGDAEMDLVAAILSEGISSRLYQKLLYENKLAIDVSAFQESMLLGSLFNVEVTVRPGVALDTVERAIDEVLEELKSEGPTAQELQRQKAKIEYRMVSRLQSLFRKADQLNAYQFFYGEPNSFQRDLNRYRDATRNDVREWARRILTPDARLILRVIPRTKPSDPSSRNQQPAIARAAPFAPRIPQTFKLSNGITVHHWQRNELPMVELSLLLPTGTTSDPVGQAGLASLTADMLDEGAGSRGAIEFADALDLLGANLTARSRHEMTTINLTTLTRNFVPALALFADAVRRPRFDAKEWKRVHNLHVQRLIRDQDSPTAVAGNVAMRLFFGEIHPYSRPNGGTPQTARSISLDDVKRFYAREIRPSGAVFLVAGDLSTDKVKADLEKAFGSWRDPEDVAALETPQYPPAANQALRVAIVDRPNAVQTVIRFIMPGPVYADSNRLKLQLFNTILGGSFTSRLNQNLREKHGYTYGARCRFTMDTAVGYFTASSSVRANVTGASIKEFLKEFSTIRGGNVSGEEVNKARAARRMRMIQSFAGLGGIISSAATLVRNHRPFSDLGDELQAISQVDNADLNHLAYGAVPLEQGLLVLVGDRKLILHQLADLDLPTPIVRTVTGEPVTQ